MIGFNPDFRFMNIRDFFYNGQSKSAAEAAKTAVPVKSSAQ